MLPSSQMSEIDIMLSQVNVFLSKIDVMLSECPDVHSSRSPVLPRMGNILSKMESIVAQHLFDTRPATDLSWDDAGHEVLYPEEEDLNYSLSFVNEEGEDENIPVAEQKEEGPFVNEEEKDTIFTGEDEEDDKKMETEEEDEEVSVAQRVKRRRNLKETEAFMTTPPKKSYLSPSSQVVKSPRKKKKKCDPFLAAITRAIGKVAPKSVYSNVMGEKMKKERDERKVANIVPEVLRSMWETAESLWIESEEVRVTIPDPYPTLDWSKVNKRFISNIPSPTMIPKHGCAVDPAFYEYTSRFITGNAENTKPKFQTERYPFGSEYGYRTNLGIISVSSTVHHGYVWNEDCWTLHAQLPNDQGKDLKENKFEFQKKPKRKKV